jgi:hypothetical protein
MPKIVISGIAHAVTGDPRSDEPLTDNEQLAALHGIYSDEVCSDYFSEPPLSDLGIRGGRLRFAYDENKSTLRITTAYDVPRNLTEDELTCLIEATLAQWSDGIGSGSFRNHRGEVLSTTLAMAIQNSVPSQTDLGNLFVDAYPFAEDRDIRVEFSDVGGADDELLQDLVAAVESGEASALVELGQRYQYGNGVEQNDNLAFNNYSRAAALDHPWGVTLLGECLLLGQGTTEDQPRAVECFRKAAAAGVPLAMHYLGECYTEGYGVPTNLEEAVKWYHRGADLGDPGCLAELGDCLEFGRGIAQDLNEALRCYQLSLERGFDAVQDAITRVERALDG